VIVVTVDADDTRAVNGSVQNFCGFKIGGDKDTSVETLLGGLRGDGVGQIAGGRAADSLNSKRRAAARAVATTRSLKESDGKQTASFLT